MTFLRWLFAERLTFAVAWYGAVIATLSLAVSLYVAWRDRSRIHVTYADGYRLLNSPIYDPKKDHIVLTVANRGRRPVTIGTAGFRVAGGPGRHVVLNDSLSRGQCELGEGKAVDYAITQDLLDPAQIIYPWAKDAVGRIYRGRARWWRWRPRTWTKGARS